MKKALYYENRDDKIRCLLCPHFCLISEGDIGRCGVRQNREGVLYSLVYEQAIAVHVDAIEKKPLFHVYPGSKSFSVATMGCNFTCRFCQNHDISQVKGNLGQLRGQHATATQIAQSASDHGCKTVACTYTEPTIYFEYALDIAKKAKDKGVETVWVSNGYITPEPLEEIAPYLTAMNIDLKGWDKDFYRNVVGGKLSSVLKTLELAKSLGIWLEVTTLMVPEYVDDPQHIREIATFIRDHLGSETPWHISRFYPQYECDQMEQTPVSAMRKAMEIGQEVGLKYVYSGNVPGDDGEHTRCYRCGELLIERYGFNILKNRIQNGQCSSCQAEIHGIGMSGS